MFEIQAKERINFLRNTVWTHLNQLSQQCVNSDEVKPSYSYSNMKAAVTNIFILAIDQIT